MPKTTFTAAETAPRAPGNRQPWEAQQEWEQGKVSLSVVSCCWSHPPFFVPSPDYRIWFGLFVPGLAQEQREAGHSCLVLVWIRSWFSVVFGFQEPRWDQTKMRSNYSSSYAAINPSYTINLLVLLHLPKPTQCLTGEKNINWCNWVIQFQVKTEPFWHLLDVCPLRPLYHLWNALWVSAFNPACPDLNIEDTSTGTYHRSCSTLSTSYDAVFCWSKLHKYYDFMQNVPFLVCVLGCVFVFFIFKLF